MPEWTQYNGLLVPSRVQFAERFAKAKQDTTNRGRFFSHMAYTQSSSTYGYEKPAEQISFDMLTQSAERSLIDSIIINARALQMKNISRRVVVPGKEIGWRVVHKRHADPNYKPTNDVTKRCKEMEDIIENVNRQIHPNGGTDFGMIAMQQELVYDRKAMVIGRDRTGMPVTYHLVDGPTVKPIIEVLFSYMKQNKINDAGKAIQDIYNKTKIDLTNAAFVQIVDGMPVAAWRVDEMSVNIANPSVAINRWAYGAGSMLEKSIQATISWMNVWSYNDKMFQQDSPESLLFLYGDYDPIGLGAFQRQVLDQSGSGDFQKIPVIPADSDFKAELVKIRELPKDLQFAEFLRIVIQLKTAAYRAHPSIVNFSMDKGGSGNGGLSIGANDEEEIISKAHEEGFVTIVHGIADWLTEVLIRPRYDDLILIYDTDLEDETARIELLEKQIKVGMTFNEARRAQGLVGDLEYGDIPDSNNYVAVMNQQQQMKMAQEQQQQQMTHEAFQQDQEHQHQDEQSEKEMTNQSFQQDKQFAHDKEVRVATAKEQAKNKQNPRNKPNNLQKNDKFLVLEILE